MFKLYSLKLYPGFNRRSKISKQPPLIFHWVSYRESDIGYWWDHYCLNLINTHPYSYLLIRLLGSDRLWIKAEAISSVIFMAVCDISATLYYFGFDTVLYPLWIPAYTYLSNGRSMSRIHSAYQLLLYTIIGSLFMLIAGFILYCDNGSYSYLFLTGTQGSSMFAFANGPNGSYF